MEDGEDGFHVSCFLMIYANLRSQKISQMWQKILELVIHVRIFGFIYLQIYFTYLSILQE